MTVARAWHGRIMLASFSGERDSTWARHLGQPEISFEIVDKEPAREIPVLERFHRRFFMTRSFAAVQRWKHFVGEQKVQQQLDRIEGERQSYLFDSSCCLERFLHADHSRDTGPFLDC